MFKKKYNIVILSSKWYPIGKNLKLTHIPRQDEFVYWDTEYYRVLTVIHVLNDPKKILIVVDNENPVTMGNYSVENQ